MKYIIILLSSLVASCSNYVPEEVKHIVVVKDPALVQSMRKLSTIEKSSSTTGMKVKIGRRTALNAALKRANALGATHFLILEETGGFSTWSVGVKGVAYKAE